MSIRVASALLILSTIPVFIYLRPMEVKSFQDTITGVIRSLFERTNSSLPQSLEEWRISDMRDLDVTYLAIRKAWKSLEPFFASRGYILYQAPATGPSLFPAPSSSKPVEYPGYPYGRRTYISDQEADFCASSMRVFPARDSLGQDVIIKVIADGTLAPELEIMRFLNTEEARSDPRNHTIPIIEFIKYAKFTFVVMPRWCQAFWPDFGTVKELMHFTQSFLEAFDFLHENHIAHADFLEQNTAMDVVYNENDLYAEGLRNPFATRYALIDFEGSKRYPPDIPIEEVLETRPFNFSLRGLPEPEGPYNPFQVDVISLGLVLQRWVRHIEDIVPELGPFFDCMVDMDPTKRFTARQASKRFMEIYTSLSSSQLEHKVVNRWWQYSGVVHKSNS